MSDDCCLRLAPSWPTYDAEYTLRNWPAFLRLIDVTMFSIGQDGVQVKLTFKDQSWDIGLVTPQVAAAGAALMPPSSRSRWYAIHQAALAAHPAKRAALIKFHNSLQQGVPAASRTAMRGRFDHGHPPGLVFDTPRFQAHGHKYFQTDGHTIQLRADAPIIWKAVRQR